MATSLSEREFADLLGDPRCPVGLSIGGGGFPIIASELVRVARVKFGDAADLESQVDAHVRRVGGARLTPTSFDNLARRALRRLAGKENPPAQDIYEIPKRAFGAERR